MSGIVHEVSVVHIAGTDSDHIERATDVEPPAPNVEWDSSLHLGISRERKIELMQAFEAGMIIEYESTPSGIDWLPWDHSDEAGSMQPQLGDARYPDGSPIQWRIPDQEQVVVEYKVGVLIHPPKHPEAVIARDMKELYDMRAMYHTMRDECPHMELVVDTDEALIERKITLWVRKAGS